MGLKFDENISIFLDAALTLERNIALMGCKKTEAGPPGFDEVSQVTAFSFSKETGCFYWIRNPYLNYFEASFDELLSCWPWLAEFPRKEGFT